MNNSGIQNTIKSIVANMVEGKFQEIYERDYSKKLKENEIKEAIEDYPGRLTLFPDTAFNSMRLYRVTEINCDIDFPLWYDNEISDLTMVCNIQIINDEYQYTIEGILVQ